MKKRLGIVGVMILLAATLCACGNKDYEGINPDKYVKLGDYKNISVDVTYYDYTQDELAAFIDQDLESYVSSYDLYDYKPQAGKTTVSENDIVNIDYVGKKDDVAFDGGTAQGAHLEIGSGSYIPGFEEGLVGAKVGECVDLNLTFPEDYGVADLAGADVVFTVSVNSIDERLTPEYDEAFITNLGVEGVTNLDEYLAYADEYMTQSKETQNNTILSTAIWEKLDEICEVSDVPQELIDKKKAELEADLMEYANLYGVDRATMLSYMGKDEESFATEMEEDAKTQAKKELICLAIAKAEGIKVSDDDIKTTAEEQYEQYNYESADDMIAKKGEDYLRTYVRQQKVVDLLKEVINITELETISLFADYM